MKHCKTSLTREVMAFKSVMAVNWSPNFLFFSNGGEFWPIFAQLLIYDEWPMTIAEEWTSFFFFFPINVLPLTNSAQESLTFLTIWCRNQHWIFKYLKQNLKKAFDVNGQILFLFLSPGTNTKMTKTHYTNSVYFSVAKFLFWNL